MPLNMRGAVVAWRTFAKPLPVLVERPDVSRALQPETQLRFVFAEGGGGELGHRPGPHAEHRQQPKQTPPLGRAEGLPAERRNGDAACGGADRGGAMSVQERRRNQDRRCQGHRHGSRKRSSGANGARAPHQGGGNNRQRDDELQREHGGMGGQARHAAKQHHLPGFVVYRGKPLPCVQKRLANEQRAESKQRGSDGAQQHRKQHRLGAPDAVHAYGRCREDADAECHSPKLHDVEIAASGKDRARPGQKQGGWQAGREDGPVVGCERPPASGGGKHSRGDMVRCQQEEQGCEPDVGAAKRHWRARQPCIGKHGAQQRREHRPRWPRPRPTAPRHFDPLGCMVGHALPCFVKWTSALFEMAASDDTHILGARWSSPALLDGTVGPSHADSRIGQSAEGWGDGASSPHRRRTPWAMDGHPRDAASHWHRETPVSRCALGRRRLGMGCPALAGKRYTRCARRVRVLL